MTDVFLSYSRSDRQRVRYLAQALTAEGFSVWWDPEIRPGAKWDQAIRKFLEQSACVVTCWTRDSVKSKWVLAETTFADGQKKLVPAILQRCAPPIPYNMVQSADLTGWKGANDDAQWLALLEQVKQLVDARRKRLVVAPPPAGEAHGQTRAMAGGAAAEPMQAGDAYSQTRTAPGGVGADDAFMPDRSAYIPPHDRPRAGGGRMVRFLVATAVTLVLTAGVIFGPGWIDRFDRGGADSSGTQASGPTQIAANPVNAAPIQAAPSGAAAPSPEAKAAPSTAEPAPPEAALPQATPPRRPPPAPAQSPARRSQDPVSTSVTPVPTPAVQAPGADPRLPWINLDACTQRLAARCPKPMGKGFADDMVTTRQEATFLRGLGVETSTINAEVAGRCERVLASNPSPTDPPGLVTPFGKACGVQPQREGLSSDQKAVIVGVGAAILGGVLAQQGQRNPAPDQSRPNQPSPAPARDPTRDVAPPPPPR